MDPTGAKEATANNGYTSNESTLTPPRELAEKALEDSSESNDNPEVEEEEEYPHGFRLALITLALCLSVFCMALDNTIIATAIPRITDQFKSLDDIGWYGSAYLLTNCALQLIFGKLYTFYNIKWIYLTALFIFEIGSLLCGVAPNSTALIIGRAIAGIGGSGVFSGAILIISKTVPLHQRPSYTSAVGSMYGIAPVRWCFYINLPIGAVTAAFIVLFVQAPKRVRVRAANWREQLNQFDVLGTTFFIPAVVCLLLALQWAGSKYPWANGRIIALFVIFGLSMACFMAIQIWKKENATVPPRIMKNRNVWGSAIFSVAMGASFFGILPVWFQAIKGVSAIKSGIMNLPLVVSVVIFTLVSGGGTTSIGYYGPFFLLSAIQASIGAGLLTTFEVTTDHSTWIGYQVLYGAGVGLGMQLTFTTVQAAIPVADIPVATALMMFSQTLGGALFISITQNVFSNLLTQNLIRAVPGVDPSIVVSTGATELKNVIDKAFLPDVLLV